MALTKDKKKQVIDDVTDLLKESKMTVLVAYAGTPVKAMQSLRRKGQDNGTVLKVVKNRLVIQALKSLDTHKDVDVSGLNGMLLYGFNPNDEVAPAQTVANFAKTQPSLKFVGAISAEGTLLSADEVKALASLPSKNQLIAQVVATLNSPLDGVVGGVSANLHGILEGIEAKAN